MTFPRWIDDDQDVNLREVAPKLFVGAHHAIVSRPGSFDLVIDLCGSSSRAEGGKAQGRSVRFMRWPFPDGEPIPRGLLDAALHMADDTLRAGGRVLVHCAAGQSRSVSVAYALLREMHGLGHEQALSQVQANPQYPMKATLDSARAWVHERSMLLRRP